MSDWHKDLSRVPEEGPLATLGEHAPAPKGRVRRQVEADEVKRTLPAPRDGKISLRQPPKQRMTSGQPFASSSVSYPLRSPKVTSYSPSTVVPCSCSVTCW